MKHDVQINEGRLIHNIAELSKIGAINGGGVCRPALSTDDQLARDWLGSYILRLGLELKVDQAGNMFGIKYGEEELDPVITGSHLDTVFTGGIYDGSLGVLAGLEVLESLVERNFKTKRPLILANFTNEEGVRFSPDMMGSLAFSRSMTIEDIWNAKAFNEDVTVKDALKKTGYLGNLKCGEFKPHAFVELHIEQGPILEKESLSIGLVEQLQGIFWTKYVFTGKAAHAGTTPLAMRSDSLLASAETIKSVREIAASYDGVGTVGSIQTKPNAINVVAEETEITVDLRHPDIKSLAQMQIELDQKIDEYTRIYGVKIKRNELVRFDPVVFNPQIVNLIEENAMQMGLSSRRMTSGAGHDAQMMARVCPASMIFVPSVEGISHNVHEKTSDKDVINGANLLFSTVLSLAQ